MPEDPLSEEELIDAYRSVRRGKVQSALMGEHIHYIEKAKKRILLWHSHTKFAVGHSIDIDQPDGHPEGDLMRKTLKTSEGRKVSDLDGED